jgi:hypothetical protein
MIERKLKVLISIRNYEISLCCVAFYYDLISLFWCAYSVQVIVTYVNEKNDLLNYGFVY